MSRLWVFGLEIMFLQSSMDLLQDHSFSRTAAVCRAGILGLCVRFRDG